MQVPTIHQDPPPVRIDADGEIRVGKGRHTLAALVEAWNDGLAPAAIAVHFRLALPDVLGAMAYYFRYQAELRPYLEFQASQAAKLRAEIEASQQAFPTRAELMDRRDPKHVEAGQ